MGTPPDADVVDSLLTRLEESFLLDREVTGATLRDRLRRVLRDAAEDDAPGWGSRGDAQVVRRRDVGALTFLYRPHLFPGMDDDLRLGHRVQYQLLPRALPASPPVEVTAVLESFCHLSGDVFGWRPGAEGSLTVWLMDVSGHGVEAGLAAVVWKLLIDETDPELPLAELVRRIERRFDELRNPVDRTCRYATAVLLRVDPAGRAEYLSAGHPPALVVRSGGAVEELGPTCLPLALLEGREREVRSFEMCPSDVVLLGTDGLVDAGELRGGSFGLDRVAAVLRRDHADLVDLADLAESLYAEVARHADVDRLDDDLSFLLLRRR